MAKTETKTNTLTETKPETETNTATEFKTEPIQEKLNSRKINMQFEDAMHRAIKQGKKFKLIRKTYVNEEKNKRYNVYSSFIVLPGSRQGYREVQLLPEIGYVDKDAGKNERTMRNQASYELLEWLYDCGQGLSLVCKEEFDSKSQKVIYVYNAEAVDFNGVALYVPLVPRTSGEKIFIQAAFCGYGLCRDFNDSDIGVIPGLAEALAEELTPGEIIMDN